MRYHQSVNTEQGSPFTCTATLGVGHHSVEHLVGRWVSVQEFCLLGSRLRVSVEEISTSRPSFQSCSPSLEQQFTKKRESRQWCDVALLRQCLVGSMDVS